MLGSERSEHVTHSRENKATNIQFISTRGKKKKSIFEGPYSAHSGPLVKFHSRNSFYYSLQ